MSDDDINTYNTAQDDQEDYYLLCGAYDAMNQTGQTCKNYEYQWKCTGWGRNRKCKWQWVCTEYEYEYEYSYYTVSSASNGLSAGSSSLAGSYTYDDNRHGVGTNPAKNDSDGLIYYSGVNWAGNPFAFRAEVERDLVKNGDGTYDYTITSWLKYCSTPDCKEYFDDDYYTDNPSANSDNLYFSDTSRFLCHDASDDKCDSGKVNTPTLEYTIALTQEEHERFDTMMFGFTEATGGSTQTATYSEFILQFIKDNDYNYSGHAIDNRRRVHNRKIY